ncbi:MAG: HD domain-containing protein [Agathobacter sp.]|nr:HD domain-containing protein [Agathobacter sp.]
MGLTVQDFKDILNVGIQLTVEKDSNKLLNTIVEKGMQITNCDASTLYLYEDDVLKFRIMRTLSQNVYRGVEGEPITDIPPVPFKEENVCAYTAIHRKVINIEDVYDSEEFDFSGPKRYDAMTGFRTQSMLVIPVENNTGELIGVLQMMNAQDENGNVIPFDPQFEIIIRSLGSLAAIELTNIQYVEEIKAQLHSFVEAMATAIDERTPYNGSHTRKVAEYATILAKKINEKYQAGEIEEGFDEDRLERLQLAALLHDIGKMIIPRSVMNRATRMDKDMKALEDRFALLACYYEIDFLKGKISEDAYQEKNALLKDIVDFVHRIDNVGFLQQEDFDRVQEIATMYYEKEDGEKIYYITERENVCLSVRKGTLTEDDRKIMESHVVMTAKILSKVRFNKNYANVPRWAAEHHEYLDGSGYPNHISGNQLDTETRILAIADIYDALTANDRPYKPPMPKAKACAILHSMANEGKLEERFVGWLEEAVMADE